MQRVIFFFLFSLSLFAKESVYCIHGFMRSPSSMERIATAFKNQDFDAYTWGYPSRKGSIDDHALSLVKDLQKQALKHPNEPIHFVTHSLGGLIVRAALNHIECPNEAKIGKAVLLSPPNQGTSFGRFLKYVPPIRAFVGNKVGKELLTTKHFEHLGQFPKTMDVLIISGTFGWNPTIHEKNDGKVGVTESCLTTPHHHITLFLGHSWMMFSKAAIHESLTFITNSPSPRTLCTRLTL